MKWVQLFLSDLRVAYPSQNGLKKAVMCIANPSLRACILLRLAQMSPRYIFPIWRNFLITFHSIDVGRGFSVDEGFSLPHPICVVIGSGVKIDKYCTVYQNVTLGRHGDGYPTIGHGSTIFPNSVLVGSVFIEPNSRVKACSFIYPESVSGF